QARPTKQEEGGTDVVDDSTGEGTAAKADRRRQVEDYTGNGNGDGKARARQTRRSTEKVRRRVKKRYGESRKTSKEKRR
ncbi:MAG: hypothetical protein Q9192_009133, partial [Flavoplaca navasiana]